MESKKTLKISAAVCDVRNVTEELLSAYEKVQISAATVITNQAAQVLMGKYAAEIDAALTLSMEEGVRLSNRNGSAKITAGQTLPDEKIFLLVNGSLDIEPGSEEALKAYAGIVVNGSVTYPESMTNLLGMLTVNGSTKTYPDGAILLKNTTVLDRIFHLRAKQDTLYYAAQKIVALAPDIDFGKLAEKNVTFMAKRLLVSESLAEAAVPLFDERADIVVLPDGCAYVDDDAELDSALLKRYGGKLYINGSLTIGPDSAPLLDQVSYLKADGDVLMCRNLKDRVMAMDIEYDGLRVVGGVLIMDRGNVEISAAMLENAEDGVSVMDCAVVSFAEDVTPDLLRDKLVSIGDCATVQCTPEQRPVIEELARDVALITSGGEMAEAIKKEMTEDENVVKIDAASYTF